MSTTKISAYISEDTKSQVDAYVQRRGVKKAFLVEAALQHYLQAMRELPEDVVIPTRLVLDEQSTKQVADLLDSPREPTHALKDLMGD